MLIFYYPYYVLLKNKINNTSEYFIGFDVNTQICLLPSLQTRYISNTSSMLPSSIRIDNDFYIVNYNCVNI